MKLSTAVSVLLTAPAFGYVQKSNFGKSIPKAAVTSSTSLGGYLDSISTTIETPKTEWVAKDDTQTAELKKNTGFTEGAIREEYSDWCMKYDKVADEARYMTYKKNFLMQEEYNQQYGSSFSLNGYGDMTERKCFFYFSSNLLIFTTCKIHFLTILNWLFYSNRGISRDQVGCSRRRTSHCCGRTGYH